MPSEVSCWPPGRAQPRCQRGAAPWRAPRQDQGRGAQSHPAEAALGPLGGAYLLVQTQAQREAPAVLLIPVLGAQQVPVEVRQGQAGPEVRAQHADRGQHDGGVGHGACGAGRQVRWAWLLPLLRLPPVQQSPTASPRQACLPTQTKPRGCLLASPSVPGPTPLACRRSHLSGSPS